jgi:hypothetical protein
MDAKTRAILDSLTDKPPRSRLEPHRELILDLRRRGRTYRDIANILAEKCQVEVTASGVHDFLRRRSRSTRKLPKRRQGAGPEVSRGAVAPTARGERAPAKKEPPIDEVRQRIAALKTRSVLARESAEQFQYDPDEPLHLPPTTRKA